MVPFTRHNIATDPMLPEIVRTRLIAIKDAIEALCTNGFYDDWIVDDDIQRERIERNLRSTWISEDEWRFKKCNGSGSDCCKISIWYHYHSSDTWQNAIWIQVNDKEIFIHSPLANHPNQRKRFAVFSSSILYINSTIAYHCGLPNPPTFAPEFIHPQNVYRKQINGNFRDYTSMILRASYELCYLCAK